ncbi:MAG: DUF3568 family protein [Planctomycetes bacterium]|nr:DUF3568 family protein [Planctomycetota bacterium]
MWRISMPVLAAAALVVFLSGCAAVIVGAAAGAGGAAYAAGNMDEVVGKPVLEVHWAAQKALQELQLPVLEDVGTLKVKMKSKFSDGTEVWISLKKLSDTATRIRVRVGFKGDEARSSNILRAIKQQLGLVDGH